MVQEDSQKKRRDSHRWSYLRKDSRAKEKVLADDHKRFLLTKIGACKQKNW